MAAKNMLETKISTNGICAGLVGVVDFELVSSNPNDVMNKINSNDTQKFNLGFNTLLQLKQNLPVSEFYLSNSGSIIFGCLYYFRKSGAVFLNRENQFRVLAFTGNLMHRKLQVQTILEGQEKLIPELNEIFALALWDGKKQELLLATDRYGSLPIHFCWQGRKFYFASEAKTILLIQGNRARLNRQVLAELLMFGCPLSEETLFEGIEKIPPGTITRITRSDAKHTKYWSLKFHPASQKDRLSVLEDANNYFTNAVSRACTTSKTAIALTGGIDTRAILAATMKLGLKVDAFTMGLDNAADMKAADRLKHLVCGQHYKLVIDKQFLKDFKNQAENIVWLTEGGVLLQDTHLLYQSIIAHSWFETLVDGGCVEVSKRGPLRRASSQLTANDDMADFLIRFWGQPNLLQVLFSQQESMNFKYRMYEKIKNIIECVNQEHVHDTLDAFFLQVVWP